MTNEDDLLLMKLATPTTLEDAIKTLEARNAPARYFADYCAQRAIECDNPKICEWWYRLAGNARKAETM